MSTAVLPPRAETPREAAALPVVTRAPVSVATIPWQIRPPRPSRTVVVKATCDLVAGSAARLRAEADLLTGDVHVGGDPRGSLLYPSDFAVYKPRAEIVAMGHAYAPDGRATSMDVALRFGRGEHAISRRLRVFGERQWIGRTASAPRPFRRVALTHDNAFGGPGVAANPAGRGARPADGGPWRLPQIEDPRCLVQSPEDMPAPASLSPVSPAWPCRKDRLGTYDETWRQTRWPYFPEDFDWLSQQCAPASQQLDALTGDEPFELTGMLPGGETLRGRLPGVRARVFADDTSAGGRGFFEVRMRLDTVVLDPDAGKLHLVWRGFFEVKDERASDASAVFVALEELAAPPASVEACRAEYMLSMSPRLPAALHGQAANDGVAPGEAPGALAEQACPKAPAGPDLRGRDLRGAAMEGAVLCGAALMGCNLDGACLRGAVLTGADLTGATLSRADLTGADLTGAILEGATLHGATLDGARFDDAHAQGASFCSAKGRKVSFAHADLSAARFDGATLVGAVLSGAELGGATFDRAQLDDVRLYDARGGRVSFAGARLDGARADGARLEGACLRGASAVGAIWDRAMLRGAVLFGASLARASFAGASCQGAVFSRADLTEASFARARLEGASFLRAQALFSTFEEADLTAADLRGACLHGAETRGARLDGAKLELAIVSGTKLERSA